MQAKDDLLGPPWSQAYESYGASVHVTKSQEVMLSHCLLIALLYHSRNAYDDCVSTILCKMAYVLAAATSILHRWHS